MTRAFIRSLVCWQRAMIAATTVPEALLCLVDLEEAAIHPGAAMGWVNFLDVVAKGTEGILAKAESRGFSRESAEFVNQQAILDAVREARVHALEHVASFDNVSLKDADP